MNLLNKLKYVSLMCIASIAHAGPFSQCPENAFLVQTNVAKLYSVNLATGFYELLSEDMATSGKLNAMGYNFHDDYLYAYSYEYQTIVRIGDDYQVEALSVSGFPNTSFYVGDISLSENYYYLYRPGSNFGLYRVNLNEEASDYLTTERIINGSALNLAIYDFSFHPESGLLYSVNSQGDLVQINPETGGLNYLGR